MDSQLPSQEDKVWKKLFVLNTFKILLKYKHTLHIDSSMLDSHMEWDTVLWFKWTHTYRRHAHTPTHRQLKKLWRVKRKTIREWDQGDLNQTESQTDLNSFLRCLAHMGQKWAIQSRVHIPGQDFYSCTLFLLFFTL